MKTKTYKVQSRDSADRPWNDEYESANIDRSARELIYSRLRHPQLQWRLLSC